MSYNGIIRIYKIENIFAFSADGNILSFIRYG